MRSRAASSLRSSRVCWPRRAFAHFRVRPVISAPGSWWRARKPMSGGSTERIMKPPSTRFNRAVDAIRIMPRPEACSGSAWCFQRTMAGSIATRACSRPSAHRPGDRAGRLRSVGADGARLLVDDGMAHRRIACGVPARRQTSIRVRRPRIVISATGWRFPGSVTKPSRTATRRSG